MLVSPRGLRFARALERGLELLIQPADARLDLGRDHAGEHVVIEPGETTVGDAIPRSTGRPQMLHRRENRTFRRKIWKSDLVPWQRRMRSKLRDTTDGRRVRVVGSE